jgi:predicted ATPase
MRVRFGFAEQDFGYSVSLSVTGKDILVLSPHHGWRPAFPSDPEIRNEFIWHGPVQNANSLMISRANQAVSQKNGKNWKVLRSDLQLYESIFSVGIDREVVPVIDEVGHRLRRWRFYDFFRADSQAPARQLWNGLRTPVLSEDGHDIASALHTIQATGDSDTLQAVVANAFPGCVVDVDIRADRIYALEFWQKGLSRPLSASELSEGTLRFLLLTAALLTTRPPRMMLFNEPESSLHPSLIAPLAEFMIEVSKSTQLWVVSHSQELVEALCQFEDTRLIRLEKHMGMTQIANLHTLDRPAWSWQG